MQTYQLERLPETEFNEGIKRGKQEFKDIGYTWGKDGKL